MNYVFFKITILLIMLFFTGCGVSSYQSYYKEYPVAKELHGNKDVLFLQDGEKPQIYYSENIKEDMQKMASKLYLPFGYSSFNGPLADESEIINQAKEVKAVLVLYSKKYTNTQQVNGAYIMPQTNYMTGNAYGTGGYATFQGTQTTNTLVPYSMNQTRFDQEAVFFAKRAKTPKFGIYYVELPREKRIEIGRTGVSVFLIFENTPAYNSDILAGDILVEVEGKNIQDAKQLTSYLSNDAQNNKTITFKVIRGKEEKNIILNLE